MITPGTRLGPYEITARIGAGGMGEVFRARDDRIGRDVAIKVLPASFAADADRLQRFEQEARSAGTLNHPNLVTIYDIGHENGAPYIVMELLDGETLRDKLSSPRGDPKKNLLAIADAADAIAAAHRAGVVHRDLKPENIIVTSSGYTKVLDFGLAKLAIAPTIESNATEVKGTDPGVVMGTAGYMSPEQAQGKPADQRSDIFSLGCILYEALTGRRAFGGKSTVDTLHNIIHLDPEPVPSTTRELQRIVRKTLAKDPEERYQSAKDLAIDLRAAVRELGSSSDIAAVAPQRSGVSLLVAGLMLAAIAASIAWYAARHARLPAAGAVNIRQLTTSGDVIAGAISPDGKYLAYVISRKGQQAMWLRQIGTSQSIPLVPATAVAYWGHTFSPDGTSIYYAIKSGGELADVAGSLFQISTLGGVPRRILSGIDSAISFSPDGKQFAFLRARFPAPGQSALLIANADGSGIRTLAIKTSPEIVAPIFFASPSWSPDGRRIATAVVQSAGVDRARLSLFDVDGGAERRLTTFPWNRVAQSVWLPDGHGLIAIAEVPQSISSQLWRIDYPSGNAHPITSGSADYRNPSLTANGKTIEAVAAQIVTTLYVYPNGPAGAAQPIGATQSDGLIGVAITADRHIAYSSRSESGVDLWICDASGGARHQIITGNIINRDPVVTPDGRVVFIGVGDRGVALWRINLDGSGLTMLTPVSLSAVPSISPDGRMVYFNSDFGKGGLLYRIPIEGGQPVAVSSTPMGVSAVSRDGKWIAGIALIGPTFRLAILDAATGSVVKTFDLSAGNYTRLRWSRDGKTIYYNTNSQFKAVDLTTGQTRTALAYEPPDLVNSFDLAADGTLVISHGLWSRDAYLITGFE